VLKRLGAGLLPDAILRRTKQPYRAPDAASFTVADPPPWIADAVSERALREAGVFDPETVRQLWKKCLATGAKGTFSNTDNMAISAVLSTQLLYDAFVARPVTARPIVPKTLVERAEQGPRERGAGRGAGTEPRQERILWTA
jgi:asparagine synthase (glutamine-hydrolysing)